MRSLCAIVTLAVVAAIGGQADPAAQGKPVQTVKGGILDQIRLYVDTPPASMTVVMKPFSSEGITGDSSETQTMKVDAPGMLADRFASTLQELGPFTTVAALGADESPAIDAIVVEGRFTEMDPGSRAKRYFVGFGAGKSGVTVEGAVKSGDGTLLAQFEQRRIGVMGVAGGNSMDKLTSDTRDIGEDLAKFLSAWARGQKLK